MHAHMWPNWNNAAVLACGVVLGAACGGGPTGTAQPPQERLPSGELEASWPYRLAFDPTVPQATLEAAARRFSPVIDAGQSTIGKAPPTGWSAPEGPDSAALDARSAREATEAMHHVLWAYGFAHCRVAVAPGGFGGEVPEGRVLGAPWCHAIGRPEDAARIVQNGALPDIVLPPFDPKAPLTPVSRDVTFVGETLRYDLLRPEALPAPPAPLQPPPDLAGRLGTSCWASAERCPGREIARSGPAGQAFLAHVDAGLDAEMRRWRGSLAVATPPPGSSLDEHTRASILNMVERALHLDAADVALERGEAGAAVTLYEEAVRLAGGEQSEPDERVLAALARVRVASNQLERAGAALRVLGSHPGWSVAAVAAEAVARLAVVPSPVDSEVRR